MFPWGLELLKDGFALTTASKVAKSAAAGALPPITLCSMAVRRVLAGDQVSAMASLINNRGCPAMTWPGFCPHILPHSKSTAKSAGSTYFRRGFQLLVV